jgi:hypothetical protein
MYVERVPNRNSPPAILLREAWREEGKIRKRTLANLSHWPAQKIESLRRLLQGHQLVSPQDAFVITRAHVPMDTWKPSWEPCASSGSPR